MTISGRKTGLIDVIPHVNNRRCMKEGGPFGLAHTVEINVKTCVAIAVAVRRQWPDLYPALPLVPSSSLHIPTTFCLSHSPSLPSNLPHHCPLTVLAIPIITIVILFVLLLCWLFYTCSHPVLEDGTQFLIFLCVHGHLSMRICQAWVIGPNVDVLGRMGRWCQLLGYWLAEHHAHHLPSQWQL